jgi:Flp pilus assembly pilin Flp
MISSIVRHLNRRRFGDFEQGQTMSEYALILALIAIVGLTTWALLGTNITSTIAKVASCI